jgi:hypothetical protein
LATGLPGTGLRNRKFQQHDRIEGPRLSGEAETSVRRIINLNPKICAIIVRVPSSSPGLKLPQVIRQSPWWQ